MAGKQTRQQQGQRHRLRTLDRVKLHDNQAVALRRLMNSREEAQNFPGEAQAGLKAQPRATGPRLGAKRTVEDQSLVLGLDQGPQRQKRIGRRDSRTDQQPSRGRRPRPPGALGEAGQGSPHGSW